MKNAVKSFLVLFCAAMLGVSGCDKEPAPAGPSTTGIITGRVLDYETGRPVGGAVVSSIPPSQSVAADGNGIYRMTGVAPGTYNMRAVKTGYSDGFVSITVAAGQTVSADIVLRPGVAGNNPPSIPSGPVPVDNSSNQPLSPTLRWASSDPDGDPITYDVYFGRTNPPSAMVATAISANNHQQANLDSNTTYYWFVVAKDNKGGMSVGPVWQFKTLTPGGSQGDAANALDFQGSNGYQGTDNVARVNHSDDLSLSDGNFTVEAWVRTSKNSQYQWIASKAQSNTSSDWLIGIIGGRLHMGARNAASKVTAPTFLENGRWYHVAGVFDLSSAMIMLYIDGQLVASSSISGSAVTTSADMMIGAREFQGTPSEGFQGMIHELRIWNVARSQNDINTRRLQRLNGNEAGLVGYWPLNEGSGTFTTDRSGRGHDGHFENNPKWVKVVLPI